jgi:hypothetical protein
MAGGIGLADWFANEAMRIYGLLSETDDQSETRRLVELVGRKGGTITPRELMRSCRQFATAVEAETVLTELVWAGAGEWERPAPGTDGGKPSKRFVLADNTPDETPVDAVNGPECELDESWGEV